MEKEVQSFIKTLIFPLSILFLMWFFEIYEEFMGVSLVRWGLYPRHWDGFLGIFRSPFLHSDWGHLLSNTAPMLVLTTILTNFYKRVAIPAFFTILVMTGFSVWLFARETYHIGASGVVYGLIAFVFWSGVFRRNNRSIVLALIVAVVYGGFFQGIVPQAEEQHISWESHLLGGLVGIATAFLFKNTVEKEDEPRPNPWAEETSDTPFPSPDTFEMTLRERFILEKKRREEELRRQLGLDIDDNTDLA